MYRGREFTTQRLKLSDFLHSLDVEISDAKLQGFVAALRQRLESEALKESAGIIRKGYTLDPEDLRIDEGERAVVRWISGPQLDRDNEILVPNGAQLENFRRNPVVLLGHDYHGVPVGHDAWIKVQRTRGTYPLVGGILAKTIYGKSAIADDVYQAIKNGDMRMSSVGFIPLKTLGNPAGNGWYSRATAEEWGGAVQMLTKDWGVPEKISHSANAIHLQWDLLEHSDVAVPSNAYASNLVTGKSHIHTTQLRQMLESNTIKEDKPITPEDVAQWAVWACSDVCDNPKFRTQKLIGCAITARNIHPDHRTRFAEVYSETIARLTGRLD